ncbi:MAG: aminotransferase class V-fold PLP-dependent enzyme [Phycisphaerales bacterium]|nr:aminotransferase class V-fold PLP-dependent enzyme [Phycisphaerales bacterium]
MPPRLYADNAATSFPKPPAVINAMQAYAEELGASAGRGAYREAVETGEILADCRQRLARLIHAENADNIIFTFNCSGALNQAIKGLLCPGDHVVATMMEHNSVLRPLHALAANGAIEATYVPADPATGLVDADAVFQAVRPNTRLIAVIHASNVTGSLQPVEAIGPVARRRKIPFLVDAAQTAGHVPIDVRTMAVDLLAMPGHKGWMGPLGTGALYIRPGMEKRLRPLTEGGTGSVSEAPVQPDFMPDRFEPGSHNAIGLAGLAAALQWIETRTIESLRSHELALSTRFLERTAAGSDTLTIYGPQNPQDRVAVFSVCIEGMEPAELATLMESEFRILTRAGIHCAPFAHETIGTTRQGGTTRLSFGAYNTLADIDRCAEALEMLAAVDLHA